VCECGEEEGEPDEERVEMKKGRRHCCCRLLAIRFADYRGLRWGIVRDLRCEKEEILSRDSGMTLPALLCRN
jgi:hypothetical protein